MPKTNQQNEKSPIEKKYPFWFYIVTILIPFFLIITLEIFLRLFNYGADLTQWIDITNDRYILNPEVSRKYFTETESVPISNLNSFDKIKKENGYRIFILGGSSAAGYPYSPNGDFSQFITSRLKEVIPEKNIEVINIALTATNSYTILDLMPGVIEQNPDLILIYAGHNEYYGALGVGSAESLGRSRTIVNVQLYLNQFKLTMLVRDIIKYFGNLFSSAEKKTSGTLMSRMAREKLIPFESETYTDGLNQFTENMIDVLELAQNAGVPVILGTIVSNLKDQKPFVSKPTDKYPAADKVFEQAKAAMNRGLFETADSLFRFAKNLDALRFRAPEKINEIILKLGKKFNCPVAQIDDELKKEYGTLGNNFFIDHLHPNLKGHQKIGLIFWNEMVKNKLIPSKNPVATEAFNDSFLTKDLHYSLLDSTIAAYRIIILKNDWPFSEPKPVRTMLRLFNPKTVIDTLALKVIDNKYTWEQAHRNAALYYLKNKRYSSYLFEIEILLHQYPFIQEYYETTTVSLLQAKQFELIYSFIEKYYQFKPTALNTKWIGIISLSKGNADKAIKFLEKSRNYNSNDAQVLFNLAGAYSMQKKYRDALQVIDLCLKISPDFPQAAQLKQQLAAAVRTIGK